MSATADRTLIRYRDFWDVPRLFWVRHHGRTFVFDCPFDAATEDYGPTYLVAPENGPVVAEIAVAAVPFDPTRRASVATAFLDGLLGRTP